MIDLNILRQQVELGATPEQIVNLVEKMLSEWQNELAQCVRNLELALEAEFTAGRLQ